MQISREEARRIALAAQGFGARRSFAESRWPQAEAAIDRMRLLQLDSVNVLVRSHYLPVFSRIGRYPRAALDRRAFERGRHRSFFEYWAHEASLLPLDLHPLFRWRMRQAEEGKDIYGGVHRFAVENAGYVQATLDEISRHGAKSASDLDDPGERSGPWWGWHKGKTALEYLFWTGKVTTAWRRGFERVYDLTERVLPPEILALPTPSDADAARELVRLSAGALGIATEAELRDYFRLPVAETRRAVKELVEAGGLRPAFVEGWRNTAYLDADAETPARIRPTALLSPFDPLVWYRDRTERLFDFHYRLEFYTPGPKRNFGYFVLPFLHRGRIEARVDLKAERKSSVLQVLGIFPEAGLRKVDAMLDALAAELRHLADWLDLETIHFLGDPVMAQRMRGRVVSTPQDLID